MAPPKPLNQRGGGPALKPIKSDSCPQSYKKTTSRLDSSRSASNGRPVSPCLADGRAARVDSAEACGRVRGAARSVAGRGGQAPMRAAERASKTCRSIGTAHSPTPRPGRTSLRLPAGLHRRLAHEPQPAAHLRRRLAWSRSQATRSSAPRGALLLSRPVVVNNLLSHTPQLR